MPRSLPLMINPIASRRPMQLGLTFDLATWPQMRGWQLTEWQVLEPAARAALEQVQREYKGARCVCQARKLRHTPFCRKCFDRLKRARLARQFAIFDRIIDMAGGKWLENTSRSYFRHYDLCRDFLLNNRAIPSEHRAGHEVSIQQYKLKRKKKNSGGG